MGKQTVCLKCGRLFRRGEGPGTFEPVKYASGTAIASPHCVRGFRVVRAGVQAGSHGQNVAGAVSRAATRGWESSGNVTRGAGTAAAGRLTTGIAGTAAKYAAPAQGTYRLVRGIKNESGRECAKAVTGTASGMAGGYGGASAGAALGSMLFPGVGTIIGGVVGAFAGGWGAQAAAEAITDEICDELDIDDICDECNTMFG